MRLAVSQQATPFPIQHAAFLVKPDLNMVEAPRPAALAEPRPVTLQPQMDAGPGPDALADVLATARGRLADWGSLTVGQQRRLLRDVGLAVSAVAGGLSLRQISAASGTSESQVGAAINSFRAKHGRQPDARGPAARIGEAAQGPEVRGS